MNGPGADISEFATVRANAEQAADYGGLMHRAMGAIRGCQHPIVALIEGLCVGGSLELACMADLRIAGHSARFGVPVPAAARCAYCVCCRRAAFAASAAVAAAFPRRMLADELRVMRARAGGTGEPVGVGDGVPGGRGPGRSGRAGGGPRDPTRGAGSCNLKFTLRVDPEFGSTRRLL
jgi:hypothetical protein